MGGTNTFIDGKIYYFSKHNCNSLQALLYILLWLINQVHINVRGTHFWPHVKTKHHCVFAKLKGSLLSQAAFDLSSSLPAVLLFTSTPAKSSHAAGSFPSQFDWVASPGRKLIVLNAVYNLYNDILASWL